MMTRIEPMQLGDYQSTAEFLAKNWDKDISYWLNRFKYLWDKNPAFPEDPHRGYVVKKNGNIAGFCGYFPTKFLLNKREAIASNGFGLVVDPMLSGSGLGVKLKYKHAQLSKDKISFATTANASSLKINYAMGYRLMPRGIEDYNLYSVVPITYWGTLKLFFYYSKLSRSVYTLKKLISNLGIIKNKLKYSNSIISNVENVDNAGQEFDDLWENTKHLYSNTNIRNSDIINWYLLKTHKVNREMYAYYFNNEVYGYIIVKESAFRRIRYMLCIDLWVRKEMDQKVISSLIYYAKKQAINKNCHALLIPIFSIYISLILDKLGLLKLVGGKRNDMYMINKKLAVNITENNSYFTLMHGDRFTV